MTRPPSHHSPKSEKCCDTCKHSKVPQYMHHLLCFFGDQFTEDEINDFWIMDEYDFGKKIWAGRVVEVDDVCDEWEQDSI